MKLDMSRQSFEKYSIIKSHEICDPSCSMRMDTHNEANSRFSGNQIEKNEKGRACSM
jgi:hypothetical protein